MMLFEAGFSRGCLCVRVSARSLYHFLENSNKYFCPPDKATARGAWKRGENLSTQAIS